MKIGLTVTVPLEIYNVYAKAAEALGDCTVSQVMSEALQAYVQGVTEQMQEEGSFINQSQRKTTLQLLRNTPIEKE